MDMDGKFHIHGNPGYMLSRVKTVPQWVKTLAMMPVDSGPASAAVSQQLNIQRL